MHSIFGKNLSKRISLEHSLDATPMYKKKKLWPIQYNAVNSTPCLVIPNPHFTFLCFMKCTISRIPTLKHIFLSILINNKWCTMKWKIIWKQHLKSYMNLFYWLTYCMDDITDKVLTITENKSYPDFQQQFSSVTQLTSILKQNCCLSI